MGKATKSILATCTIGSVYCIPFLQQSRRNVIKLAIVRTLLEVLPLHLSLNPMFSDK